MEPPPKRGCKPESIRMTGVLSQWNPRRSGGARLTWASFSSDSGIVSVEPPPKRGCKMYAPQCIPALPVSVEPPPKRGCNSAVESRIVLSQWNPRRSGGARLPHYGVVSVWPTKRLSGTPAEAGVQADPASESKPAPYRVSVEPPPKRGCKSPRQIGPTPFG